VVLKLLSDALNQIFRLRQSCQQPNLKFAHPTPKAPTLYFGCLDFLHQLALNHYRITFQKLDELLSTGARGDLNREFDDV
jgi:hypothetical protein